MNDLKENSPLIPKELDPNVKIADPSETYEPVGALGDYVGDQFVLKGTDGSGQVVEWVIKPTGPNSFEMVVPKGHELGSPDAWENISIMTQRVVCKSGSCGCDGNQCGCQGQNCGSNCNSNRGRIRLIPEESFVRGALMARMARKS
jgi:hypothetical protein